MSLHFKLPILAFLALIAVSTAATAPCHDNRRTSDEGSNCDIPIIPPKLCRVCKLRPTLRRGNFASCSRIYDLSTPDCRKQLRRYARLNRDCDEKRFEQVKDFSDDLNRQGLDYFVYSVCEECCDCIPRGTRRGEYSTRRTEGTLIKVDRANCATHARFDICKVLPEIRYVKRKSTDFVPSTEEWPPICPIIRKWKDGPDGQGTFNKDEVNMPPEMRQFLTLYTNTLRCKNQVLWEECVELELAQRRI